MYDDLNKHLEYLERCIALEEEFLVRWRDREPEFAEEIAEARIREYRQFASVIQSMTGRERKLPVLVMLDSKRRRRISLGAGVHENVVIRLLLSFDPLMARRPAPSVCEEFHRSRFAGRCPWCGCEIAQ